MAVADRKHSGSIVVRNTFLEVVPDMEDEEPTFESLQRRIKSMPGRFLGRQLSTSSLDSDGVSSEASTVTPVCSPKRPTRWSEIFDEDEDEETRTTVMLRSLPAGYSRQILKELLDNEGWAQRYDFIYVPADIASGTTFFYAFINLVTPRDAVCFRNHFTGFSRWPEPSDKIAAVDWSEALQGLDNLVERYRNSPLMHQTVPSYLRPALYCAGERVEFPAPTAPVKPPRLRRDGWKKGVAPGLV